MNEGPGAPAARHALDALPAYRPGRSVDDAIAAHGLSEAIKLASNELPFEPLPSVAKALVEATREINRYPDYLATTLRERIAAAHMTTADRVAVGCGSVGLLQQLALGYVDVGDSVVFGDPSFEAYPILTRLVGGIGVPVPLRRFTLDHSALAAAIDDRTRLVLIAQPNNPTSTAMSGSDLVCLVDAVPPSCLVVLDAAYAEFATGAHLLDAMSLFGSRRNVVVLRTFSKAYGLAGLRIGYALGEPEVIAALDKCLIPFAVNRLAQVAALASLEAPGELAERVEAVLSARQRLCAELRRAGWSVPDTETNFVYLPTGEASVDLGAALEARGVVTRPFGGQGVRVTVGLDAEVDRLCTAFFALTGGEMGDRLHRAWGLPTGDLGRVVSGWVDRLDAVATRLASLSLQRRPGLTQPDPGGDERWDAGQVWAHLAEFGGYWTAELGSILDSNSTAAVAFGRTKADPGRIAAIADGRAQSPVDQFRHVAIALGSLRALLCEMASSDWELGAAVIRRSARWTSSASSESSSSAISKSTPRNSRVWMAEHAGLAYGVDADGHVVVSHGDVAIDLVMLDGLEVDPEVFVAGALNPFMALGPDAWASTRATIVDQLDRLPPAALRPSEELDLTMPFEVADYVDFYACEEHATTMGRLLRPGGDALPAAWRHLPMGYHGRSATVVLSGSSIPRPSGLRATSGGVRFGPSARLDVEVELGFVIGVGSSRGRRVSADDVADHVFGLVLVNDWSARDIQAFEYQPLGPFLGKSFATSISPWVVPLAALVPFAVDGPLQQPEPSSHLVQYEPRNVAVNLSLSLNGSVVSTMSSAGLYWSMGQQLAHLTSNGAATRTGELYASGTISGREERSAGSLMELTAAGADPVKLDDGSIRTWLEDGDEVAIRGWCGDSDEPIIDFGEVRGAVIAWNEEVGG